MCSRIVSVVIIYIIIGSQGHFISSLAKNTFFSYFSKEETYRSSVEVKDKISEKDLYLKLIKNNYEKIKIGFHHVDQVLRTCKFETETSGTSLLSVFQINNKLVCANVGNSMAIVGFYQKNKNGVTYETNYLFIDKKNETLKERINPVVSGQVDKNNKNIKPIAINKNEKFSSGTPFPRGDFLSKKFAVLGEPNIIEFEITNDLKFLILASDGLWRYLSFKKIVDMVINYYKLNDCNKAIEKLIEEATICWKRENNYIEDITIVIVFF